MQRRTFVAFIASGVTAFAVACGTGAPDVLDAERAVTPVEVEPVTEESLASTLAVEGVVEPQVYLELAFGVDGVVSRLHVEEGEVFAAGAPIAELDLSELERAVRDAHAALARAEARLLEAELSRRAGEALPGAGLDALQAERSRAERALVAAGDDLSGGVLRAPVPGIAVEMLAAAGEFAEGQRAVVRVADLSRVRVRAGLPPAQVARVRVGAEATVRSVHDPGRTYRGRVRGLAATVGDGVGSFSVEVEVVNPELRLRPQAAVQVELPIGPATQAHSVPLAAVLRGAGGRPFSFVVNGEGEDLRVGWRPVSLGPVHGERVVIGGLARGERVITRGQHFVTVGDRVRIDRVVQRD